MTANLIDSSVFAELSEAVGADFAAELVTTFLDDANNMFSELNNAVASEDVDAYRRAAHSIKSNAQTFGADALADKARTMELNGLSGCDSTTIATLKATFAETASTLRDMLND